jgi:hypothetical protein
VASQIQEAAKSWQVVVSCQVAEPPAAQDQPEVAARLEHCHQCLKLKKANFQREDFQMEHFHIKQ